jgi:hypothetical protein
LRAINDYKVNMHPKDATEDGKIAFTVRAKSVMEAAEQARAMYPNHNLPTYPWKMS